MICQVESILLADATIDSRLNLVMARHFIIEDDTIFSPNHVSDFFFFCTFFNLFGAIFLLDREEPELLN